MTGIGLVASFKTPLVVEYEDGRNWIVREPFVYISQHPAIGEVFVPAGFETDFASIPRFLWRLMWPTHPHIGKAAVIHDFLYRTPGIAVTRWQADDELRSAMGLLGATRFERTIVFLGVRAGGERAFRPRMKA